MVDFLKLTTQQINNPFIQEGNSPIQINQDEPVSIHEINETEDSTPQSNVFEQMGILENAISDDGENADTIGNLNDISVIENTTNILKEKTQALDSLNTELSKTSENLANAEEKLTTATNELATVMNNDEESNEDTIQEATQNFIKAQEEYEQTKEYENTLKEAISTAEKEKNKAKQELLSYIEILKNEQEKIQNDSIQSAQEKEDLQTTIDELSEEISIADEATQTQEQENQQNDSSSEDLQNQTGVVINDDNSVSQSYEDGSVRTFYVQKDENDEKYVTYADTLPQEEYIENTPQNNKEDSEFLEEVEQFIN